MAVLRTFFPLRISLTQARSCSLALPMLMAPTAWPPVASAQQSTQVVVPQAGGGLQPISPTRPRTPVRTSESVSRWIDGTTTSADPPRLRLRDAHRGRSLFQMLGPSLIADEKTLGLSASTWDAIKAVLKKRAEARASDYGKLSQLLAGEHQPADLDRFLKEVERAEIAREEEANLVVLSLLSEEELKSFGSFLLRQAPVGAFDNEIVAAFLGLDQDQRAKVFAATRAALQKIQSQLKAAPQKGVPPPPFNDDQMFSIQVMMLQHLTAEQVRTYFQTVRGHKEPHHFEAYMTQLSPANVERLKALLEKDAPPR